MVDRCRQAFWDTYSNAADDAAHALAALRNKEAAVRDVFKRAVSRLIPPQVGVLPSSPFAKIAETLLLCVFQGFVSLMC